MLAEYLPVVGVAFAVSFLAMPLLRWLAFRVGAVDQPDGDARRVHKRPTALLGGAGLLVGFLAGMATARGLSDFDGVFASLSQPLGVVVAALAIFIVGQLDDLLDVSALAKLAGIVLAGSLLSLAGVSILFFRVPFFGLFSLSPDMTALLTVVWVAGMANAINFIDGLDGLAGGIVAIAAGALLLYSVRLRELAVITDDNLGPLIAACVLGACLGYLPWNFHPAKIFMGDAGALLLGLLMAAATISIGGNTDVQMSGQAYFFFAPLFLPLVILGVPILDTAWAILRRATQRSGVSIADKGHLHHRLMALGHGQRRSVLILWVWTAILSALVLYPTYTDGRGDALVPLGIIALALILYTLFAPGWRARRNGNGNGKHEGGDDEPEAEAGEAGEGAREAPAASGDTRAGPGSAVIRAAVEFRGR
jgi:UDP-GlcNAc:undecaprenyl-phosphate/decaprenyl-phosphate GlcNAc-1-phosphate transferase